MEYILPAIAYGKLPSYGDFVRVNAGYREVRVFDKWIQEGIYYMRQRLGENWKTDFVEAVPFQFLIQPPNCGNFLVGILNPSRDEAGRLYPFWIGLLANTSKFSNEQLALAPILFSSFLERALQTIRQIEKGVSQKEMQGLVEQLAFNIGEQLPLAQRQFDQFVTETTQGVHWKSLYGNFEDERRLTLMSRLFKLRQDLLTRSMGDFRKGLQFPLFAKETFSSFQSALWATVGLRLLGNQNTFPTLFWTPPLSRGNRQSLMFFQHPSAKVIGDLVQSYNTSQYILPLDKEISSSNLESLSTTISPRFQALMTDENLPLATFLNKINER